MGHCQAISTSQSGGGTWKSPIRSTHGFATETWDLKWDPIPSTILILSHDQNQRLLPNSNQTTGFQCRKAMRVVGVACMKRTPARNSTGSKWRQTILGSMDWRKRQAKSIRCTGLTFSGTNPQSTRMVRAQLLMCLNRSGPRWTPPYLNRG